MKLIPTTLTLVATLFISGCVTPAMEVKEKGHLAGSTVVPFSIDEIAINLQQYNLRCENHWGIGRDLTDDTRAFSQVFSGAEVLMYTEYQEMPSGTETTVTTWVKYSPWKRKWEDAIATISNPDECVS